MTAANFKAELPYLKQSIQEAAFIALDCEMTGLWVKDPEQLDNYESQYGALRTAASQHMLVQLGVSCFKPSTNSWTVHSYNITLFPALGFYDPTFGCRASTMSFLSTNGFNLAAWVAEGVPFVPLASRTQQLLQMEVDVVKADAGRELSTPPPSSPSSKSGRDAIKALADERAAHVYQAAEILLKDIGGGQQAGATAATTASVDWDTCKRQALEWLATAEPGTTFTLPTKDGAAAQLLQALLRLTLWQRPDLPAFTATATTCTADGSWGVALETSPAPKPGQPAAVRGQAVMRSKLHQATGAAVVLELIQEAGVPVVVHNGVCDLAFIMHHLRGEPMPRTWPAYKAQICHWFPGGVFDTKYLGAELAGHWSKQRSTQDQSNEADVPELGKLPLVRVFGKLCRDLGAQHAGSAPANADAAGSTGWPRRIQHAPGCESYQEAAQAAVQSVQSSQDRQAGQQLLTHEAGFDAFMAGAVFLRLVGELAAVQQRQGAAAVADHMSHVQQYKWRIYGARGVPYYNLTGPDLPPNLPLVFMVTGIDPQMSWQEISRCWQAAGLGSARVYLLTEYPGVWGTDTGGGAEEGVGKAAQHAGKQARQKRGQKKSQSTAGRALVQTSQAAAPKVMQQVHLLDRQWTVKPVQQYLAELS